MVSNTCRAGENQKDKRVDTYFKIEISKRTTVISSDVSETITLLLGNAKFIEISGKIANLQ